MDGNESGSLPDVGDRWAVLSWGNWTAAALLLLFAAELASAVIPRAGMFFKRYDRAHRLSGLAHLVWLGVGFLTIPFPLLPSLWYDVVLGVSGIVLTLTAAHNFRSHRNVTNVASGTLDEEATVTHAEMVEHSFYQGLNLAQILYLHAVRPAMPPRWRMGCAAAATLPWLARGRFPVNKFSDNYTKAPAGTLIGVLYRLKKYQYLLYKHCLLHGLNVSVAIRGRHVADDPAFRLYWLCLNTAYVMEFFLQSLVKRKAMRQGTMLRMQQWLMLVSTFAALQVLRDVDPAVAAASFALNFAHRHHDVLNTVAIMAVAALCRGTG
eukprot:EG_transcript_15944